MAILRPPGPRDWFFGIPTVRRITRDFLGFYTEVQRRYGDIVYMKLGPYQDYTVFHPDYIKEVLVDKAKSFIRMERQMRVLGQWNGNGLLISEGETWLRYRRLVQPAFHPKRLTRYSEEAVAAATRQFAVWPNQREPINFEQAMTELTMQIIARTMFGSDLGENRATLSRAVRILSEVAIREMTAAVTLPDWLPLPGKTEKRWAMRTIDATVRGFIRERRAAGVDQGDLLSMLLLAVDEEGDRRGLSDEQARDQCVTIFLAGHDTTAAGMTWIGWALASHPDIAERAAAEVREALADRQPSFADLPKLPYVERVVKESLRLYPPAIGTFARQALHDVEIAGWTIPKDSLVRVFFYVAHHDPCWFPDPERFDPDRFAPGRVEQMHPFTYLPFGAGPRVCIGNNFAMMEMTLLTAMLLQRFTLAPAPGQGEPGLSAQMSLRPAGGLHLVLTKK